MLPFCVAWMAITKHSEIIYMYCYGGSYSGNKVAIDIKCFVSIPLAEQKITKRWLKTKEFERSIKTFFMKHKTVFKKRDLKKPKPNLQLL